MELVLSETNDRPFNWKVLLENYSENYHTPFVHPELDTSSSEDYPMISDGVVLYAWDRPLRPSGSRVDEIRATLLPGEPGWEELASIPMDGPYGIGGYLTVWPNLMMNVFPGAFLAMWMEPIDATTTRVERRLFVRPEIDDDDRKSIIDRPSAGARPRRRHLHPGAAIAQRRHRRRRRAGDGRRARRLLRPRAPAKSAERMIIRMI